MRGDEGRRGKEEGKERENVPVFLWVSECMGTRVCVNDWMVDGRMSELALINVQGSK